jgi:small-conductance mechanosensitive channel
MKNLKITCLLFVSLVFLSNNISPLDFRSVLGGVTGADAGVGLLVSDIEFRREQLKKLEEEKKSFGERAKSASASVKKSLEKIVQEGKQTSKEIAKASGSHEELLKKKVAILKERAQNLHTLKDLWLEIDGQIVRHIELVKNIEKYLEEIAEEKREPASYSWKDLNEARDGIDDINRKIESQTSKIEGIKSRKADEKEEIALLNKDIVAKNAEKNKTENEYKGISKQEKIFALELRTKIDVIEQEIDHAREKIEVATLKLEKFGREERLKEDEIFLLKQKRRQLSASLAKIQKNLRIDAGDVASTKAEFEKERRKASLKSSIITQNKRILKSQSDDLHASIKTKEQLFAKLKDAGKDKSVAGLLVESSLILERNKKRAVDGGLDYILTQKDSLDALVRLKQLAARVVEVLHDLKVTTEKFEEFLTEFRRERRLVVNARKRSKDKREELISLSATVNATKESLQKKQKEIADQRGKIFRGREREYFEVLKNLKEALGATVRQKFTIEQHSSKITELLSKQDDIIYDYNYIISYLESQWTVGIWKRSHRAISIAQVGRSIIEFETFFKKLFWDTPAYLGPTSIINSLRSLQFVDYMGIALFFLFFILFFLIFRLLLVFVKRKAKKELEPLCAFFIEHFFLLFSWLFLFSHILLSLSYFKPLTVPYIISIFYLISIPVLMYISHRFILWIRTLNQQLGYMFISEKMQEKVTTLMEIFLYATSVILPLRKAFLEYFEHDVAFSVVSLAAYTLIVVIVILLFFNKEDVLKLLSSPNPMIVWLHRQVDAYYYPVFSFCMFLLILSNPYIGYSNMAWYLVFAVPAAIFLFYGLFIAHYFVRKYSLFFFIKEEDDEVVNKFEHAKAYYGFFVATSFIVMALGAFLILVRIWGVEGYTLASLWKSLSEDWAIDLGGGVGKLGFVELIKFGMFIAGGLAISSLIKRFILGKLFEIFRTEPGVQNTASKITHYFIIILAVILGFTAINLSQYALALGTLLAVGIGFGLKDQIVDYFGGVLILLERPIEIGHYVETGEYRGRIHQIAARSTTIKTAQNFLVIIPNRELITKPIINWGQGRYAIGCELEVMVAFDSDPELVQKVLLEVLKNNPTVLRVPSPVVRLEGFETSALMFFCRCFITSRKLSDMWTLQSELRISLMKAFKENNIVIPYPQTVVHFPDKGKKAQVTENPVKIKFDRE